MEWSFEQISSFYTAIFPLYTFAKYNICLAESMRRLCFCFNNPKRLGINSPPSHSLSLSLSLSPFLCLRSDHQSTSKQALNTPVTTFISLGDDKFSSVNSRECHHVSLMSLTNKPSSGCFFVSPSQYGPRTSLYHMLEKLTLVGSSKQI